MGAPGALRQWAVELVQAQLLPPGSKRVSLLPRLNICTSAFRGVPPFRVTSTSLVTSGCPVCSLTCVTHATQRSARHFASYQVSCICSLGHLWGPRTCARALLAPSSSDAPDSATPADAELLRERIREGEIPDTLWDPHDFWYGWGNPPALPSRPF